MVVKLSSGRFAEPWIIGACLCVYELPYLVFLNQMQAQAILNLCFPPSLPHSPAPPPPRIAFLYSVYGPVSGKYNLIDSLCSIWNGYIPKSDYAGDNNECHLISKEHRHQQWPSCFPFSAFPTVTAGQAGEGKPFYNKYCKNALCINPSLPIVLKLECSSL